MKSRKPASMRGTFRGRGDDEAVASLRGRTQANGLSHRESTGASDRAVDASVVLVRAHDGLQDFWRAISRVGIEVHHRATSVAHRDADRGRVVALAEREHA